MARIRDEWDKLIELFAEIAIPQRAFEDELKSSTPPEPWILRTYPNDYSNKEVLTSVPYFAHPCHFKCDVITHFSFVLTNIKSKWTFGYCRHTPDSDTCLVILSDLPWHSTFYKILDHCAELATRKSSIPLERFLEALYTSEIPQPGLQLVVTYTVEDIKLKEFNAPCPDHQKLPCIPEDRNITEYYNAISAANMIAIFASMLNERRIVMVSEKLNRLSACIQAANMLIYPMHWQHIFIPLLPYTLIDYLTAPMPFLIGVPQETFNDRVKLSELGEIVLLDVDNNLLSTPFDDVSTIPSDVLHHLRKSFKNPAGLLGDGLCRAFLRALVMLIGGYRDALCLVPGEKISFDRDAFVSNVRGTSRQLFLENMLQLQIFQQFIESRLDMLNRGERFVDQFEDELNHNEQTSNSRFKSQYREWTATMKKEGGAILRAVNPKVKSAFSKGRQAFRQVRQRITIPSTNHHQTGKSEMDRPSSEPSSPKLPPIIKKSISGNFIPTPTSRTVTYVRNPQYLNSSATSGTTKSIGNNNHHSRTNGHLTSTVNQTANSLSVINGVAPSASSESSDIDDADFVTNKATTTNFMEELESIFQGKLVNDHIRQHSSSSNTNQRTNIHQNNSEQQNNNGDVRLPVPPPRISLNRPSLNVKRLQLNSNLFGGGNSSTDELDHLHNKNSYSATNNSSKTSSRRHTTQPQCLIEFDSPPREIAGTSNNNRAFNPSFLFDPLLSNGNNGHQLDAHSPETPKDRTIHTLHVSNSNFYVAGQAITPPITSSNLFHQTSTKQSTSTIMASNGRAAATNNNSNPFGEWQMFD